MTQSIHSIGHILIAGCLVLAAQVTVAAGSVSNDKFDPTTGLSADQRSSNAFLAGIKHRDLALKHEARAGKAGNAEARARALAKAQLQYKKAITRQGEALDLDPENYQAANELGFALRKSGDFHKAIGAYNFALQVNPDYHQAIEYRAEAFLALGMLQKTQSAYMQLFRNDRTLADQLMQHMEAWVSMRGDAVTEAEASFISWVQERKRLADITADLSSNNTHPW